MNLRRAMDRLSIFIFFVLTACQPQDNLYSTPSATPILSSITIEPLPSPSPRPSFINNVSPVESDLISIDVYRALLDKGDVHFDVRENAVGHNSSVCVNLNTGPLLENNDYLVDWQPILERLTLTVDGQAINKINFIMWRDTATCSDDFEGVCNTQGTLNSSNVFGADWIIYCWQVNLDAGTHDVLFQFRQTSGKVQEYNWLFALSNEPAILATLTPVSQLKWGSFKGEQLCQNKRHGKEELFVADVVEVCGEPDMVYRTTLDFSFIHLVYLREGLEFEVYDSVNLGYFSQVEAVSRFQSTSAEIYWQNQEARFDNYLVDKLVWDDSFHD